MRLPMSLRPPPPIPDIISPNSRDPQTNQIHLPRFRLQLLRFRTANVAVLELPLACVVRLCGLIDVVCGGDGGDAGETCVKDLLWGWLWQRFLLSVVVVVI